MELDEVYISEANETDQKVTEKLDDEQIKDQEQESDSKEMENTKSLNNEHSDDNSSVDSDENRPLTPSSSPNTNSDSSSDSSHENLSNNVPCDNDKNHSSDNLLKKDAIDNIAEKDESE